MKRILIFGLLLLSIFGCSILPAESPITATPTQTALHAFFPSPTRIALRTEFPSPTITPPATATKTEVPTRTKTPTLFTPALDGTPPAMPAFAIDAGNVDRIAELARWQTGDTTYIDKLVFVLGGKRVASMESCKIVERDVTNGQIVRILSSSSQCFGDFAASPDGKILISVGLDPKSDGDSMIRLWDAASGRLLRTLSGSGGFHVAFSPDGKTIASIDYYGGRISLWNPATGKKVRDLGGGDGGAVFSPDGKTVASAWGNLITVWDSSTGEEIRSFAGEGDPIWTLAFSGDGKRLATGSYGGTIRIWDFETGTAFQSIDGQWDYRSGLTFSPDGKTLASGAKDYTIRIWNTETGRRERTLSGHTDYVVDLAFSPDGRLLASGAADQSVKVWDAATGNVLRTMSGEVRGVRSIAIAPDGKTLASGSGDGSIRLWDLETGEGLRAPAGHAVEVTKLTFSPDGKLLASTSAAGKIKLWETATGEELFTIREENDGVEDVCFSPDGRELSIAAWEHLEVWEMDTGEKISGRDWHRELDFANLTFSPDGKTLAAGSTDGRLSFWDPHTGLKLATLKAGSEWAKEITYSPDGSLVAFSWGYWPGFFYVLDPVSGQTVLASSGGELAFSPDGKIFASNPDNENIRLWEVDTGRELRTLTGHTEIVDHLAFSPDGRILASISRDGTIRIWGVAP